MSIHPHIGLRYLVFVAPREAPSIVPTLTPEEDVISTTAPAGSPTDSPASGEQASKPRELCTDTVCFS